ncbi:5'-3' exonuclease [Microbulbifer yueqingensis]|uniref:5'-3' exonuclease n=1 Tax=Microbulbifer yueqingensis TaxID=658219 RepID=A0A1G9AR86_9GAMM|nr:5'-3' exonuclease H3TH domain-containing protein [Microbulbifer yueqingensis]SDK29768.1 5'-3' exonuclease [Microbulbifer yueqingensis]
MSTFPGGGPRGSTLLVDASVYIFRYYFALPPNWSSRDGYSTEAVYGFSNFLLDLLALAPARIACAFDESLGSCFRNEIYPDYKCSRALPDEALAYQLAACRQMAEVLGIASFSSQRYEADDILATLTRACCDHRPVIVSRDKDLGQLLDRGAISLWDFAGDRHLDEAAIRAKFGVAPGQIADFLALVGDASDDIPGVPGVGPKTAAGLLAHFGNVEAILEDPARVATLPLRGARGLALKLAEHEGQIRLARRLAALDERVPLGAGAEQLLWQGADTEAARALAKEFGIGGLGAKIGRITAARDCAATDTGEAV